MDGSPLADGGPTQGDTGPFLPDVGPIYDAGPLYPETGPITPGPVGAQCLPQTIPANGYVDWEIAVEPGSPYCQDGVCVVYRLTGNPRPNCSHDCANPYEVQRRIFCTCRCGGPPEARPFCSCPSGFRCEPLIYTGGLAIAGDYCVRDELEPGEF